MRILVLILLVYSAMTATMVTSVQGAGCTPDVQTHICIATDRFTYRPGEHVTATVEETVPANTPNVTVAIEIFSVPPPCNYIYLSCATASSSVILRPGFAEIWSGSVSLRIPDNVTAGNYAVEAFGILPLGWASVASTEINVTG